MSPAEAGAIEAYLTEPDWLELWAVLAVADDGFEAILKRWRYVHHTLLPDGRRLPAPATDGVVALAELGIFAPRSLDCYLPCGGAPYAEQHDSHCWLTGERAWRITAIEDRMLMLDSFGEQKQLDLNRAGWIPKYCQAAIAALEAHHAAGTSPASTPRDDRNDPQATVERPGGVAPG